MAELRFHLPPGAWIGTVEGQGGWPLRAMLAEPAGNPRGTLLFLNGRADFLEKYAETYPALTAAGWRVAAFDWRGQGGSGRFPNAAPGAGHADFETLLADLAHVWRWAAPDVAVAHSMGAHLLMRHLAAGAKLKRAVLLAPLFDLAVPPWVRVPARLLARAAVARGRAGQFATGQRPYGAFQQAALRMDLLTSDAQRFADEHAWLAHVPSLALGGVTWGWLDGLARSAAALTPAALLAPLFDLAVPPWVRIPARLLARAAVARGRAGQFAAGQRPYGAFQQAALRMDLLTSDAQRFADEHAWLAHVPSLALGGVTWGWLDGFARSAAALTPAALRGIDTPMLILLAQRERLVSNAAATAAAARLPRARLESVPGGAHELLREADPIRDAVLARLLAFLA